MSSSAPPSDPAGSTTTPRVQWPWLAYLVMLLFQPAFDPGTGPLQWAVVGVVVVVYVPVYVVGFRGGPRALLPVIVATLVLGIVVTPINGGGSVLFVYAAAFAGALDPPSRARGWMVVATVAVLVLAATSPVTFPYDVMFFAPAALFIWVVGHATLSESARERESARLRLDNVRIEHLATVGERERIARDLHDVLGHTLTAVVVRAQLVQRLAATDPDRATEEARGIETAAREALGAVRETVTGYRAASLQAEIEQARAALAAVGVALVVDHGVTAPATPSTETALALALREAVTNVVRHAGARTCRVTIARHGDEVRLQVADDGRGGGEEGNGLRGMRERISLLGGRVERTSHEGTTVTVDVPAVVAG